MYIIETSQRDRFEKDLKSFIFVILYPIFDLKTKLHDNLFYHYIVLVLAITLNSNK